MQARLRRRWERGELLSSWAGGNDWEPLGLPLTGPTNAELATRFDDIRAWAAHWRGQRLLRVEERAVGSRSIGATTLPVRVWIDSWDVLWQLLVVRAEVTRFGGLREATVAADDRLLPWVDAHPLTVLAIADVWLRLVRTVRWLEQTAGTGLHLRQVPVPGVDTKLIQQHAALLSELLDLVVSPDHVDLSWPRTKLARRYGFAYRPEYVRFRVLDPALGLGLGLGGVSEMSVRVEELPLALPATLPTADTVVVVENETTYLAFPALGGAVVMFGSGYAKAGLSAQPWWTGRRVRYWGDIDTHGFAILAQVRAAIPQTESLLMDRATLLHHESQWVSEPVQRAEVPAGLTAAEAELHRDLVEGRYGVGIRLEQERVSFDWMRRALWPMKS